MKVEIKILDSRVASWGFPNYGSDMAAGLDLYACIDAPVILPGDGPPILISTGVAVSMNDGNICGLIVPRSGLGHRQGLVLGNTVGVIDPDYQGPCLMSLWNRNRSSSPQVITINPGDRVAQLIFLNIARPEFKIVDQFSLPTDRGSEGFGSTGTA